MDGSARANPKAASDRISPACPPATPGAGARAGPPPRYKAEPPVRAPPRPTASHSPRLAAKNTPGFRVFASSPRSPGGAGRGGHGCRAGPAGAGARARGDRRE